MRLFKKTNIDFLGKRKMWYIVSTIMVLFGMFSVIFKGITYGIDFQGGTELVLAFQQKIAVSEIRVALNKVGLGTSEIKSYGGENNVLIRTSEQAEGTAVADKIKNAMQNAFPDKKFDVLKEDKIGPKIGKELRNDAMLAVLWSFVAILAYVAIRFKFAYGFGAVIALMHDVFATFGFLSLLNGLIPGLNLDISQEIIAAFLTLIGVSVNDTVIIFDRIRENEKIYRSMPLFEVMNKSLNETLSRTIITSSTIFIVLIILLLFGGEVNRGFAFTMAFGIVTGTYSSIYVASAFVLDWTRYKNRKTATAAA
ncbi:MAG: protein translocase subunit SecF [Ignavibacteriae bacterium]|nr:MAG: protein translocase subunit SecF [Ignavibacteriota bacterium]